MEKLTFKDEDTMRKFHCHLQAVTTPDDIFPPEAGVLAHLPPPFPTKPGAESISVAAIHELCLARQQREAIIRRGEVLLHDIDLLIEIPV